MDLYVVLGVRRGASDDDIRRAYKRLARRYHPDINPGDHEAAARFRDIPPPTRRWSIPSAAALRSRRGHGGAAAAAPASPASTSRRACTPSRRRRSAICSPASSCRRPPSGRPARGADIHTTVTVPLATVLAPRRHDASRGATMSSVSCAPAAAPGAPPPPSASPARAPAACRPSAGTCSSRRRARSAAAPDVSRRAVPRPATAAAPSPAPSR